MSWKRSPDRPLTVACPYFSSAEQEMLLGEFRQILNGILAMGPRVAEFELKYAAYCGVRHGVALPSCTAALEVALRVLGVGAGDEVLVPIETFFATGAAVERVGARPVFTEASGQTLCMDFNDARSRITSKTRAVIVVHFGGWIDPEFEKFSQEMESRGIRVVEDAAHAHGAEWNGRKAGSFGSIGCFSFYPTKIMTTGEGGMLVTDNADLAATARSLQNRGRDLQSPQEVYLHLSSNLRFTEQAAAMGLSQLRQLPEFLERRRQIAARYTEGIRSSKVLELISGTASGRPSYWRYACRLRQSGFRVELQQRLKAEEITVDWPYDPPLHLQPYFRKKYGTKPGDFPRTEKTMESHLCLPLHARLEEGDADFVLERIESIGQELQKVNR